jgi:multiple sugar transport system permease protein
VANYNIAGDATFVGLENFRYLAQSPLFWNALRVTAVYVLIAVPAVVGVSLGMAYLSSRAIRGIAIYRALFFLPVITSLITSAVIWQWIYSANGPLNWLVSLIGSPPMPWLSSGTLVLPSLSALGVWSRFGFDMLILLAGILAIPAELDEAAIVDGASAWQRFRFVTLPQLRRPLFVVVVLEIIVSFQVFDIIFVMTGGGPVRSSYSLVYFIYDQGLGFFRFGIASAAGVVLLVITLMITLLQRRFLESDSQ